MLRRSENEDLCERLAFLEARSKVHTSGGGGEGTALGGAAGDGGGTGRAEGPAGGEEGGDGGGGRIEERASGGRRPGRDNASARSLTDNGDGDNDSSSWDDTEEGETKPRATELRSKNEEFQLELNAALEAIANMSSELNGVRDENCELLERLDRLDGAKVRTFPKGDATPSVAGVSLGSDSSSFRANRA